MFKQMLIGLMLVVVATIGVMGGYFWQSMQELSKPLPTPVATASIEEQKPVSQRG